MRVCTAKPWICLASPNPVDVRDEDRAFVAPYPVLLSS